MRVARVGWAMVALLATCAVSAPHAAAQPTVPCGVLDQIRASLDNDVSAGLDGVRTVISSPYGIGRLQQRDAADRLNMVNHGVHVIQDINTGTPVPGLAPLLDRLAVAAGDAKEAVLTSFGWSAGGTGGSVAMPTQSTWDSIDYANQKKNDVYGLLDGLHGNCTPG